MLTQRSCSTSLIRHPQSTAVLFCDVDSRYRANWLSHSRAEEKHKLWAQVYDGWWVVRGGWATATTIATATDTTTAISIATVILPDHATLRHSLLHRYGTHTMAPIAAERDLVNNTQVA
jgi:hypothetical protein